MATKKSIKKTPKAKSSKLSFEQALAELEQIVADLEGGELGLDDALAKYEQGVERLKQCQEKLESAERRIELLSGVDAQGNPISQPLDDSPDDTLEGKAAKRSRKRGANGVDDKSRLF